MICKFDFSADGRLFYLYCGETNPTLRTSKFFAKENPDTHIGTRQLWLPYSDRVVYFWCDPRKGWYIALDYILNSPILIQRGEYYDL